MARWLIWSEEHGSWVAGGGMTRSIRKAARFHLESARELVEQANSALDAPALCLIALEDPVPGYDADRDNISRLEAARRWPEDEDEDEDDGEEE